MVILPFPYKETSVSVNVVWNLKRKKEKLFKGFSSPQLTLLSGVIGFHFCLKYCGMSNSWFSLFFSSGMRYPFWLLSKVLTWCMFYCDSAVPVHNVWWKMVIAKNVQASLDRSYANHWFDKAFVYSWQINSFWTSDASRMTTIWIYRPADALPYMT